MAGGVSSAQHGGVDIVQGEPRARARVPQVQAQQVWAALARASFAIVSYVTPSGEPRSSGIVYGMAGRHLYLAVAPGSWKARQIRDGQRVAVTVPVRRGGLLSLLAPIPPATISFHARAIVHSPGSIDLGAVSKKLESLLPKDRRGAIVLELVPEGTFLSYGIGVSLRQLADPAVAQAHVPIG
jgi:Pyridoxamine 5'-phosphate oxidase